MRRFFQSREFFIPKGAVKIADRKSDAVVYLYTTARGKFGALGFHGKAAKPDWHFTFSSEAARERKISDFFAGQQRRNEWKDKRRAERAKPHTFEVGHVLVASWGYEQTNINFYQVTRITGPRMVELREVAQVEASNGNEAWATGKSLPAPDGFIGETIRRIVNDGRVKIDAVRSARLWDGRPVNWTAYH